MVVKLTYTDGVYEDREDSWLLQKEVEKHANGKFVLDVGCGTGIQGITACKTGARKVICTDVNPKACFLTRKNAELNNCHIDVVCGKLLEFFKGVKFDLIVFNTPYLPSGEDIQWSGGKELIREFLEQASNFVNKGGEILLVFSSLTGLSINDVEIISEEKVNFETLYLGKVSFL
jgi:release factor glutamine methyltransferase